MRLPIPARKSSSWVCSHGSATVRQTEVVERVAGSLAKNSIHGAVSAQANVAAALASTLAIIPLRPPAASAHLRLIRASSTHNIDGVLMVMPSKTSRLTLPPLVIRKTFGSGQGGVYVSSRSTAAGLRTIMPCAASPPINFCQDQVVTSNLSHCRSMAKTAEVASQNVNPWRSAAIQSASGTRTPDEVPFQVKTTSRALSTWLRSGRPP